MTSKYYVVLEGREMGVFDEWEQYEAGIEGHAGGMYKCFYSLEAAQNGGCSKAPFKTQSLNGKRKPGVKTRPVIEVK
jgi:hypothetical protein